MCVLVFCMKCKYYMTYFYYVLVKMQLQFVYCIRKNKVILELYFSDFSFIISL